MKIYIEKAIFVNRTPMGDLNLDFQENEINVLTAVNGKGKTTILSYIVDAFHEMARPNFPVQYEGIENKLYRLSSSLFNLDQAKPSFVYLRFRLSDNSCVDYIDVRNTCTEQEYKAAIPLQDIIPFDQLSNDLTNNGFVRKISGNFDRKLAEKVFSQNILTYFPSYRYEMPSYLNDPYKLKLEFNTTSGLSGKLKNPIEVVSGLSGLVNWLLDVALDLRDANLAAQTSALYQSLCTIITDTLVSKNHGSLRFGIGPRNNGGLRIQILKVSNEEVIYPTISGLSAGEAAVFSLFGEILKQADTNKSNGELSEITGIVLVDEIDKHLHIKLQKEVLPRLLSLFPNLQFILSSHSPFLTMGLSQTLYSRSKVIDLDNFGVYKDISENNLYAEVYEMMIDENNRFKELYEALTQELKNGKMPIVVTEGKTDVKHLKKAKEKLGKNTAIAFFEAPDSWGDNKLKSLLELISKLPQSRRIIGLFDRDNPKIIADIETGNQSYKDYGNNVFAFCIPRPSHRTTNTNISIEFYYLDEHLKKEADGKRIYFDNEIELRRPPNNHGPSIIHRLDKPNHNMEAEKKVYDENIGDYDWIHSKSRFADLLDTDEEFSKDFLFDHFEEIFNKIEEIIQA